MIFYAAASIGRAWLFPHRLVTVHEAVILRSAGTLTPSKLAELVERVYAVIRAGGDV